MSGGSSKSSGKTGKGVQPFLNEEIFGAGFGNVRSELFRQMGEALNTGGVGARVPMIQQAVSQQRQALGQALTGTEARLARSGQAGTAYGNRTLAQMSQQGQAGIGQIPTQVASELMGQVPGMTQGLLTAALGALAGAGKTKSRSSEGGVL